MIARPIGSFLHRRFSIVSALTLVLASAWCAPALAGPPPKGNPDGKPAAAKEADDGGDADADTAKPNKENAKAGDAKDGAARKAHGKHAKRSKDAAAKGADPYTDKDAEESEAADSGDESAPAGAVRGDGKSDGKSDARGKKDEHAKNDAKGKDDKPGARPSRAGHVSNARPAAAHDEANASKGKHASSGSAKGKKTKKTASRNAKKKAPKKADSKAPQRPCLGPTVALDRNGTEAESLPLVDCAGKPRPEAQARLSLLARPWGVDRPESGLGADVGKLDAGLLTRLDAIARKFPGRSISVVSGYRPQSRGSLHQSGRAVDLRVTGVSNVEVVGFCRTIADTGCGFYPNSSFVHVDVRAPGTGVVHWIDASGPGEAPRYVSAWPPPPGEMPSASAPPSRNEAPPKPAGDAATPSPSRAPGDADNDSGDEEDAGVDGSRDDRLPELPSSGASQPFGLRSRGRQTPLGPSLLPAWDTAPRR